MAFPLGILGIPGTLWEGIQPSKELEEIQEIVLNYFEGDVAKANLWFRLENPSFGEISPIALLRMGRLKFLHKFAIDARDAELAAEERMSKA